MAPGSIFHHISFQSTLFCNLYFSIYIMKIPKIFILSYYLYQISLPQVTMKGLTTLYRVGCEVLVCLCRYEGLACNLLLDWYLGSQKLREILTLLCCITFPLQGKTHACSRGSIAHLSTSRRPSGISSFETALPLLPQLAMLLHVHHFLPLSHL